MNKTEREELRRLCEEATQAPWQANGSGQVGHNWLIGSIINCGAGDYTDWHVETDNIRASQMTTGGAKEDAEFIAAARNLVPGLIDALDAAEQENQRLSGLVDDWQRFAR